MRQDLLARISRYKQAFDLINGIALSTALQPDKRLTLNLTRAFFFASSIFLIASSSTLSAEDRRPVSGAITEVSVENGLLSLDVSNAPLFEVLLAIGSAADVTVHIRGELDRQVTIALSSVPLEDGIRRLLRTYSFALSYSSVNETTQDRLTQISVIGVRTGSYRQTKNHVSVSGYTRRYTRQNIHSLARRGDPSALSQLGIILLQDNDPLIRKQAAAALGWTGQERAVEPLRAALADPSLSVRTRAVRSLKRILGTRSVQDLREVLRNEKDPKLRRETAKMLATIPTKEARLVLQHATVDPNVLVRRDIAHAIARWERRFGGAN